MYQNKSHIVRRAVSHIFPYYKGGVINISALTCTAVLMLQTVLVASTSVTTNPSVPSARVRSTQVGFHKDSHKEAPSEYLCRQEGSRHEDQSQANFSLQQLLQQTKRCNPKVHSASHGVNSKKSLLEKNRSARLPLIKVSSKALKPISNNGSTKGTVGVNFELPIFNLALHRDIDLAQIEWELEASKKHSADQAIYLSVLRNYYSLLASILEQRVGEDALKNLKMQIAASPENSSLKAQYYELLASQQTVRSNLHKQQSTLQHITRSKDVVDLQSLLTDAEIPKILSIADLRFLARQCEHYLDQESPHNFWMDCQDQEQLFLRLINSSPKCVSAYVEHKKAQAQWRKAEAAYYPTVKFLASGNSEAKYDETLNTAHSASCSLDLAWTFFDSGKTACEVASARSVCYQKKELWLDACSEVEKDLTNSLMNLERLYISWLATKLTLDNTRQQLSGFIEPGHISSTGLAPHTQVYTQKQLKSFIKEIDLFDSKASTFVNPATSELVKYTAIQTATESLLFKDALDSYLNAQQAHIKVCFDLRLAYYELAVLAGLDLCEVTENPSALRLWVDHKQT